MVIIIYVIIGLLFIFLMTNLGAILGHLFKNKSFNNSIIMSFSLGIMISSGIFSLLIPSIKESRNYNLKNIPTIIGFIIGILIMIIIPKLFKNSSDKNKFFLAMTIHNIPEGFSVGLSLFFAYFSKSSEISLNATILFIAIGIQNIPEGLAVFLPYKYESTKKAYLYTFISSIVEPVSGILAYFFINNLSILPYALAIGAGAMIYTGLFELHQEFNKENIISFIIGFSLMTLLDLLL